MSVTFWDSRNILKSLLMLIITCFHILRKKRKVFTWEVQFLVDWQNNLGTGRREVGRGGGSASWNFSFHIVYIFKKPWNFLTKTWYSDQMHNRKICTPLCLKSETFANAQLMITFSYILLRNILAWYQLETYIKVTLW